MKIQLGGKSTRGLGAGSNPEVGRDAALEDHEKLLDVLEGVGHGFRHRGPWRRNRHGRGTGRCVARDRAWER